MNGVPDTGGDVYVCVCAADKPGTPEAHKHIARAGRGLGPASSGHIRVWWLGSGSAPTDWPVSLS